MGRRNPHKNNAFVSVRQASLTRMAPPAELDLDSDWFLVFTGPRAEQRAADGLKKAGCSVFLPKLRSVIRFRRRIVDVELATFPRYLFASGLPNRRRERYLLGPDGKSIVTIGGRPIADIREIDGVTDVVRTPNGWARVPREAIERVAAWQAEPGEVRIGMPIRRRLKPGETVTISDGPFASLQAQVVEAIGLDEASVLVDIFGRATVVTLGISQLDAA